MRIAYSGMFLGEGLRLLGHVVAPLCLRPDRPFNQQVEDVCPAPDLVVLELWGQSALPLEMRDCRHRLAAYCIDTPLNTFWLRHALALCDDVFVDQLSSVAALRAWGIAATWLPLCAFENDFMPPVTQEHFLTFVGRVTEHRLKRRNLLRLLQKHFPITIVESVSHRQMLELFARSQVVLNENLFGGLTLRVFQALASGSLLLTEAGGQGLDAHFTDGEHLVAFDATNVCDILEDLRRDTERCREIGRRGQALCRKRHTSLARARAFMAAIAGTPRPKAGARDTVARRVAEATARYCQTLRHGGAFSEAVRLLGQSIAGHGQSARQAAHVLGSFEARRGDAAAARPHLAWAAGLPGADGFVAAGKLALTFLHQGDCGQAARILAQARARLPEAAQAVPVPESGEEPPTKQALLLFLAHTLIALGRVCELGFLKPRRERYPDSAFEYAWLAWDEAQTPQALDALIACARASGTESEIVPTLLSAIASGLADDAHILYAAELTRRLYDADTAMTIAKSLRRSFAHYPGRRAP